MGGESTADECTVDKPMPASCPEATHTMQHFRAHNETGARRSEPLSGDITTTAGLDNMARFLAWGFQTNWKGWEKKNSAKVLVSSDLAVCWRPVQQLLPLLAHQSCVRREADFFWVSPRRWRTSCGISCWSARRLSQMQGYALHDLCEIMNRWCSAMQTHCCCAACTPPASCMLSCNRLPSEQSCLHLCVHDCWYSCKSSDLQAHPAMGFQVLREYGAIQAMIPTCQNSLAERGIRPADGQDPQAHAAAANTYTTAQLQNMSAAIGNSTRTRDTRTLAILLFLHSSLCRSDSARLLCISDLCAPRHLQCVGELWPQLVRLRHMQC